jgi:hypothetical protein
MAMIRAVRWLLPVRAEVTEVDGNCPACGGASLAISHARLRAETATVQRKCE